jgi:PDZ domain-containing protein
MRDDVPVTDGPGVQPPHAGWSPPGGTPRHAAPPNPWAPPDAGQQAGSPALPVPTYVWPDAGAGVTPSAGPTPEPVLTPRAITLSVATVTTALLVGGLSLLPVPYAVTLPGPTFDTLGDVGGVPLIEVEGAETYPSAGELRFTTVRLRGGESSPVSLFSLVQGWLDGAATVVPVEDVLPPDQTPEEIDEQNQAAMISSQENATVSALEELGYQVPTTLRVGAAVPDTGAWGVVEEGDVLLAVDGVAVGSFSELSAVMDGVTPGADVVLTVERDGEERELTVTTVDDGSGKALIGVLIDPEFHTPIDVTIQIENVGGPSAGLMFSLGIINALTEPDETGGRHIAGTGTMDLTGKVGPIGGIVQKMVGATSDGAEWFLAPESNCDEVVGNVPSGLDVVAVGTLAEARAAVEAIGSGRTAGLRTCEQVVAGR